MFNVEKEYITLIVKKPMSEANSLEAYKITHFFR